MATPCQPGKPLTLDVGDPDTPICSVGSLTLWAQCIQVSEVTIEGNVLLDTSTDGAFVASDSGQSAKLIG